MTLSTIKFKLTGISPILMHNGQLADTLNSHTKALKALTGKRKKSDDDLQAIADTEWRGGLYVDDDGKPCLPGHMIEAAIVEGAKKSSKGKQATAGLFVDGNFRLTYSGPKDVDALEKDSRFRHSVLVKVQRSRVMRTRPIFRDWSVEVEVTVNSELINPSDVVRFLEDCGEQIGIGDWRPRFGRFLVEEV